MLRQPCGSRLKPGLKVTVRGGGHSVGGLPIQEADVATSNRASARWRHFARSFDPNSTRSRRSPIRHGR